VLPQIHGTPKVTAQVLPLSILDLVWPATSSFLLGVVFAQGRRHEVEYFGNLVLPSSFLQWSGSCLLILLLAQVLEVA
jgi:hypothetical protein